MSEIKNQNNNIEETPIEKESTISEILYQKRIELNIDINDAALYLKIKKSDIEAIENGEFENITKHLYLLGTLRSYARFLKIDQSVITKKITAINVRSNIENKKHQLINIGENNDLKPSKDQFFNFLLVSILLFLVLLSIFNFYSDKSYLITNEGIIEELQRLSF